MYLTRTLQNNNLSEGQQAIESIKASSQTHIFVISDYKVVGDPAQTKINLALLKNIPNAGAISHTAVPPTDTESLGFNALMLAGQSRDDLPDNILFYLNSDPMDFCNEEISFYLVLLTNGVFVAGLNAGYSFSYLNYYGLVKEAWEIPVEVNLNVPNDQTWQILPKCLGNILNGSSHTLKKILDFPRHVPWPEKTRVFQDSFGNIRFFRVSSEIVNVEGIEEDSAFYIFRDDIPVARAILKGKSNLAQHESNDLVLAPGSNVIVDSGGEKLSFLDLYRPGGMASRALALHIEDSSFSGILRESLSVGVRAFKTAGITQCLKGMTQTFWLRLREWHKDVPFYERQKPKIIINSEIKF